MIWVRRFFVLPVGAAFLVLLGFSLLSARAGATLYEPEFFKRHLDEQDVYGFILGDLAVAATDELRSKPADFFSEDRENNPFEELGLSTADLVSSINAVFPQEWGRGQAEEVIDQIIGFFNGERDDLDVRIAIDERVPAAAQELKSIIKNSRLYSLVLDDYLAPNMEEALEQGVSLFESPSGREDVLDSLGRTMPEEWFNEQVGEAIDEAAAYMSGQRDKMAIHVPLYERTEAAIAEVKVLYAGSTLDSDRFVEEVASDLATGLPDLVEMPSGVFLTEAEVVEAARSGLSGPWVDEQVQVVVASVAPYMLGSTNGFQARISTTEGRDSALAAVEALVWERIEERLAGLPRCGEGQQPFLAGLPMRDELPRCSPPGTDTMALLEVLDVDVTGDVERLVGGHFPDSVEYTDADLRLAAGGEDSQGVEAIDQLRTLFSEGWTYTEVDLQEDWADWEGDGVENLRTLLTDGWQLTLSDLDGLVSADGGGTAATDALEQLRSLRSTWSGLTLMILLALAALLAAAGYLGGQTWRGRIAWASATLAATSLLLFLVTTLSIGPVLDSGIAQLREEAAEDLGSPAAILGTGKALDIVQSMGDDFMGGLAGSSLWLIVIGAVAFGLTFLRSEVLSRFRRSRQDG